MPEDEETSPADVVDSYFAAVDAGDTDAVRLALHAEPTLLAAVDARGTRAPLAALFAGHPALADELAATSAPLDIRESSAFDDNGQLRTLIRENPAAVADWSLDGWQPLHLAARFGRVEAVRQLLDADAPEDEPSRNEAHATPLHLAAAAGHGEITWLLIASGADVDRAQRDGSRPLHLAAAGGHTESVQALLAADADPEATDGEGHTPRDVAIDPARALFG